MQCVGTVIRIRLDALLCFDILVQIALVEGDAHFVG